MDLKGIVRRFGPSVGETAVRQEELGNLAISQVLPPYTQLCKAGKLYSIECGAGTAIKPVVEPGTTSPEWALYNGNSEGGPCLVLLSVSAALKSGTAGLGLALLVGVTTGKQTTVPTDYSGTIKTNLNGGPFNSKAILANNPALVGGTPAWMNVANHGMDLAVDAVGAGLVAPCYGAFIARPGYMICCEVLGETGATALYYINFVYAELELDIE